MLDSVAALVVIFVAAVPAVWVAGIRLSRTTDPSRTEASPVETSGKAVAAVLTALGALLTLVYMIGLNFHPRRLLGLLGIDSAVVVAICMIGVAGLVFAAR